MITTEDYLKYEMDKRLREEEKRELGQKLKEMGERGLKVAQMRKECEQQKKASKAALKTIDFRWKTSGVRVQVLVRAGGTDDLRELDGIEQVRALDGWFCLLDRTERLVAAYPVPAVLSIEVWRNNE